MYIIDQEKLEEVTTILNSNPNTEAPEAIIKNEICADWNEGAEHQDWINNSSAAQIADWLASFYTN